MPPIPSTRRALLRRAFTAAAAATALAVVAGCSGDDGSSDDSSSEPDQVSYLTGFGASAHDAFIFVADEQGYFEDAGIDVEIQLGGGTQNNHALLADEAQFTYTDYTGMLIDISNGEFEASDFRALSAVHQSTLVAILAPESAGVSSPQDLEGLRIGAFAGSPTELLLPAYAELSGWEYDPDLVVPVGISELFGLIPSGQADVLSTFIIQKGVISATAGEPMVEFPFNRVLDDLLGTGLISTASFADENPDLVQRFRDAALKGLEYTIEHPEEAIDILADRNPGAVDEKGPYVAQIETMAPYITSRGEDQIGVMDEAHVMRCITVLEGAGLVEPGIVPEDLIGEQTLLASSSS